MSIYLTSAHEALKKRADDIRVSRGIGSWRCITCKLDKNLYDDVHTRNIATAWLDEKYPASLSSLDIYWLKTGCMFILFDGKMNPVKESFEKFLDFICEGQTKEKPLFELLQFSNQWHVFEEILAESLKEVALPPEKKSDPSPPEKKAEKEKKLTNKKENKRQELELARARRAKPLLLLVEDERMTQAFIEALLEPYCEVIVAPTVTEGQKIYYETLPNLVFMDINLPDGNGQDLLKEFMAADKAAWIVMVSAHISDDVKLRCMDLGAKGFVHKPVVKNKDRLMAKIFDYNSSRYSSRKRK